MPVLQVLSLELAHGDGIAQRLEQIARSLVPFDQSSPYPALYRLRQQAWLRAGRNESEIGRDTRFYCFTPGGRKQFVVEKDIWARFSGAVNLIFEEGSR